MSRSCNEKDDELVKLLRSLSGGGEPATGTDAVMRLALSKLDVGLSLQEADDLTQVVLEADQNDTKKLKAEALPLSLFKNLEVLSSVEKGQNI